MPKASAQNEPREVETLTIINNHPSQEQSILDLDGEFGKVGRRYDLGPGEVDTLPVELAEAFMEQRREHVTRYVAPEIPTRPGEDKLWIANCTGNPWLPKEIKVKRVSRGVWEDHFIPNELLKPQKLRYEMKGDQIKMPTQDGGHETRWTPKKVFELPPMSRLPISRTYANWILTRDQIAEEQKIGKVRIVEEPAEYEPTKDWSIERLQAYGLMLWSPSRWEQDEQLYEAVTKDESTYDDDFEKVRAQQLLFRAVYFLLLENTVNPPSRKQFESYMRARAA